MDLIENISMAVANLKSNKMRSILTMLGIIIGIAAVIAIETVGGSMTGSVADSMSGMGVENINVSLTQKSSSTSGSAKLRLFMNSSPDEKDLITEEMIQNFLETFPDKIDHVELTRSVGSGTTEKVSDSTTTITATIQGSSYEALMAVDKNTPLLSGRWIDEERDFERNVCVVSEKFVEQVLGVSVNNAIGKDVTFTLNGYKKTFFVEGVYTYIEESSSSIVEEDDDDDIVTTIYIPMSTAKKINGDGDGYQSFTVVAADGVVMDSFMNVVGDYFSSYYSRNDTWTVEATSMSTLVETMSEMLSTISLGISAIAGISLLVGGIGVMNIMTVSVSERTKEIGTRKALGAPSSAIRFQFITESTVLCLIGGFIGVIFGLGLGSVLSSIVGFEAKPSVFSILIAVSFSIAIGVFFGYYPANKAAKLDPIEALAYE